jgi:hypothetical protein
VNEGEAAKLLLEVLKMVPVPIPIPEVDTNGLPFNKLFKLSTIVDTSVARSEELICNERGIDG